ncbi:coiled-coil domain-containing protein 89-like isoform X2 [Tachysurus fulvidraco]|uniref:coiled-coil domain-containing protein 89-like isoform X2 n=1 Tax=Tachysurus fulvidraco TaxID=1234273 RepID=UPI001FEFA205|nr:coiled-coil domain-containing protein 89-like isoform X2 [Tachysurus fulvidraco]
MFPTLVVAGAAAAGAFYYMKRRGDGESTTESTDTSPTHAPVQTTAPVDSSLLDPSSLILEAGVCSDDPEAFLDELERRYEKAMELNRQLERKNSYITVKEKILLEHLSKSRIGYKDLRNKHEQVVQAHRNMTVHYNRMKKEYNELKTEREQEKLCLAKAMQSRARMENENIELLSRMSTLRCSMRQLKEEFAEARRKITERREQEQDRTFKTSDLSPNLTHTEQRLVMSLIESETKISNVMKEKFMLEKARAKLCDQVSALRRTVKELEEMLSDSERKFDAVKQENEQLMQIHNILKMRYKRMLESITQCNMFLMNYYKEDEVFLRTPGHCQGHV